MKEKKAWVTFIIRNDSYIPGALIFAYALKLQQTDADLICIVSSNMPESAIKALKVIYTDVIAIDDLFVPHDRRHERQDRPFLFSRFHALRLGKDGDLGKDYDKILIADCDLLPLTQYDELFDLPAPAGVINEKKENCLEYIDQKYIIPDSVYEKNEWIWHEVYKDFPHGHKIPKEVTDRVINEKDNMGVNAALYLFKPSMKMYESILDDINNPIVQKEISTYNWPEMQYITLKMSGEWTNMDLRYSSFNGYPNVDSLFGIHFAGLKPWSIKNKSVKSFSKFEDYQLWNHTYVKMCEDYPALLENGKIRRLNNHLVDLLKDPKYKFKKKYLPQLSHFFN